MKAADLPAGQWTRGLITWTRNNTVHRSKPFAIEHAAGHTYLHIDGWTAHELRDEWEVTVTPPGKEG